MTHAPGPLYKVGKTDLPLLKTLSVNLQNLREPSFWKVIDCFVSISKNSIATITSLSELRFIERRFIKLGTNERNYFYRS